MFSPYAVRDKRDRASEPPQTCPVPPAPKRKPKGGGTWKGALCMRQKFKGQDRLVYHIPACWATKRNDRRVPDATFHTQEEAIQASRRFLKKEGGGELLVMNKKGRIRSKDTIAPGNDPCPPKDKEH